MATRYAVSIGRDGRSTRVPMIPVLRWCPSDFTFSTNAPTTLGRSDANGMPSHNAMLFDVWTFAADASACDDAGP